MPFQLINGYLNRETQYGPWASAHYNLRYIDRMFRQTSYYTTYADYMRRLFQTGGLYSADRWTSAGAWRDAVVPAIGDSEATYDQVMLNHLIIDGACYYEVPECLSQAVARFAAWKESNAEFEAPP